MRRRLRRLVGMVRRCDLPRLRALWWALEAVGGARRHVDRHGFKGLVLSPPPPLPESAVGGVRLAIALRRATCLQHALVLQCWHRAHGQRIDVVVGVMVHREAFAAHAWLEGDERPAREGFHELCRVTA